MSLREIDARGLACPEPLLIAIQSYNELKEFVIVVDNEVASENIGRAMKDKYGIEVTVQRKDEDIFVSVK